MTFVAIKLLERALEWRQRIAGRPTLDCQVGSIIAPKIDVEYLI